jgi:hypothetical protein
VFVDLVNAFLLLFHVKHKAFLNTHRHNNVFVIWVIRNGNQTTAVGVSKRKACLITVGVI